MNDDKSQGYLIDANIVRNDQMAETALNEIEQGGLSAAIGKILTGDDNHYDKDLDKSIDSALDETGLKELKWAIAEILVETDEEYYAMSTFGG